MRDKRTPKDVCGEASSKPDPRNSRRGGGRQIFSRNRGQDASNWQSKQQGN